MFVTICAYTFVVMNILGFVSTIIDRLLAKFNKRRIPEKVLFVIACLLGGLGVTFGFFLTKRGVYSSEFRLGVPALAVGEVVLLVWMLPGFFKAVVSVFGAA